MARVVVVNVLPDGRKFYLAKRDPDTWVKARELAMVFDTGTLVGYLTVQGLARRYGAETEPHDSP